MKLDKDMLLKQRFWILLVVSVPLTLAGVGLLMTSVAGQINKDREALESLAKKLKTLPPTIHGPQTIEVMEKKAKEIGGQESTVWSEAFKAQEPLFVWADPMEERFDFRSGFFANDIQVGKMVADKKEWPADKMQPKDDTNLMHGIVESVNKDELILRNRDDKLVKFHRTAKGTISLNEESGKKNLFFANLIDQKGMLLAVAYQKSKYFNDPLTDSEQTEFGRSYLGQIDPILAMVDPLREIEFGPNKGEMEGVVQFRNWNYKKGSLPDPTTKFLKFVSQEWKLANDISEEAWLAQEDLWIQREIYRLVREANDSIGRFSGKGGEEKNKVYTFENSYFKVEMIWPGDTALKVKVTNVSDRRQKLDLSFRVQTSTNKQLPTEKFKIGGEPLDPMASIVKDVALEKGIRRTGIYGLEQVLTWETAAIKRIDQIAIGTDSGDEIAHSQRTFPNGLRALVEKKEGEKEEKKDMTGSSGSGRGGSEGPPPVSGVGIGMAGGAPGAGGANQRRLTPNGLVAERYAEVSQQSRRIPVAIALIVDQNYVDRVLTTFNNSKLRFLVSQALLNHYPGSMRPQIVAKDGGFDSKGGLGLPPSFGPPPGMTMGGSGSGRSDGPGGMFGGGGAPAVSGSSDLEANMELVLYGMVTLYERYPPRPASATPTETK